MQKNEVKEEKTKQGEGKKSNVLTLRKLEAGKMDENWKGKRTAEGEESKRVKKRNQS